MRSFILKSLSMAPSPHIMLARPDNSPPGSGTRHLVYLINTPLVNSRKMKMRMQRYFARKYAIMQSETAGCRHKGFMQSNV